MSRIASSPVTIPSGVELTVDDAHISAKGPKGQLQINVHPSVEIVQDGNELTFASRANFPAGKAMSGTMRSLVNNIVLGVTSGFEKRLSVVGVGYRAQAQGKKLNLSLGFSHPIDFVVPEGITIETPTQTEIVVKGMDKQLVGQTAAEIRRYRPPEPYKGKGVRYVDEYILRKQAKKK
ncbi:50S ribosomal protein L6 [Pseudomonadota bacterium]